LDEAHWGLLRLRAYNTIIIRDAHQWWRLNPEDQSQSVLGMQELLAECPTSSVLIFVNLDALRWVAQALTHVGIAFQTVELSPMKYDEKFDRFLGDMKTRLTSNEYDTFAYLTIDSHAIHRASRGYVGRAVTLLKFALVDAGITVIESDSDRGYQLGKPLVGETFSSWLSRLSVNAKKSTHLQAIEIFVDQCGQGGLDPDTLHGVFSLRNCFDDDIQGTMNSYFHELPPGCLPYGKSTNYCPECLMSDIETIGLPAWRVSWRQQSMCVCCEHETPVLLLSLSTPHYTPLDKAWRAYCEYVESPSSRLLVSFPLTSNGKQAIEDDAALLKLTARVQNWLTGNLDPAQARSPQKAVVEFLLGVWLCDPSWRTAPGFACSFFFPQRKGNNANLTPSTSFASSPPHYSWAMPRQLAVAYWMLGVAFGVISLDEAEFIRRVCRPYSIPFPVDRSEIKRVGLGVHSRLVRDELIALAEQTFSGEDLEQIIWALR
jgi:hypothetical protein